MELNYKKTKFFDEFYPKINEIFNKKYKFLSDLNIELIIQICKFLEIKTSFIKSSSYKIDKSFKKENLIFEIIKRHNCSEYISTIGARAYLENGNNFIHEKINLKYFEYKNTNYQSKNLNCKHLSILDSYLKKAKS